MSTMVEQQPAPFPPEALKLVENLTSVQTINRLLGETAAQERSIDEELEQLLSRRAVFESRILDLRASTAQTLRNAEAEAQSLTSSMTQSSTLSERVSRKIRELDTVQSRLSETLQRVNLVINRTNAIDGIKHALAGEDFEGAARYVKSYYDLADSTAPEEAPVQTPQAEEQAKVIADDEVLGQAKEQLQSIFRGKLEAAAKAEDHAAVVRFAQLYAPIGMQEEGLQRFASYLCQRVSALAAEEYSRLVEAPEEELDFVGALTQLLTQLAEALEGDEAMLRDSFGVPGLLQTMQSLQGVCDEHGTKILHRFVQHRKLVQLMNSAGGQGSKGKPGEEAASVDPRQVERSLGELLGLCQRAEEFNHFALAKAAAAADKAQADAMSSAMRGGAFNVAVRELLSYYVHLEEFYVESNVDKALRIDEWTAEALTTSCVDDTFFILHKCGTRSLATGNLPAVCAVLGALNSLLAGTFRRHLEARWKGAAAKLVLGLPAPGNDDPVGTRTGANMEAAEAAATLNNANTSSTYVVKLVQELEAATQATFTAPSDRDRAKSVLADLQKTAGDFRSMTARAVDVVAAGIVPRLRPILDGLPSYELGEEEYAAKEAGDTWVQHLLAVLGQCLKWLAPMLTPDNHDSLVASVLDKVVERLEAVLQLQRFTQLGGLQLERDVRLLTSALGEVTQRTVRDKFARLAQMATLLSVEAVEEVLDFWGSATWRLGEVQVRQILLQRVDFNEQDVHQLDL